MDPVLLDPLEVTMLPDHTALTWAPDGQPDPEGVPRYRPLPSVILHDRDGRVITRWTFTAEERARIAKGEDLYLTQLTFFRPLQPMLPAVGLEDAIGCAADRRNAGLDPQDA